MIEIFAFQDDKTESICLWPWWVHVLAALTLLFPAVSVTLTLLDEENPARHPQEQITVERSETCDRAQRL